MVVIIFTSLDSSTHVPYPTHFFVVRASVLEVKIHFKINTLNLGKKKSYIDQRGPDYHKIEICAIPLSEGSQGPLKGSRERFRVPRGNLTLITLSDSRKLY